MMPARMTDRVLDRERLSVCRSDERQQTAEPQPTACIRHLTMNANGILTARSSTQTCHPRY